MDTLTTIIIPCHNGANYIAEAISGIFRQNLATEIIVVDDGSTDTTIRVAESLGCCVASIPHSGLSAARNHGLKLAHGEYILFHDHDDIMRPDTLQKLHAEFINDPTLQIVMAKAEDFISPELDEKDKRILAPRQEPYYGLLSGAVLIRKRVFTSIAAFTEDLATGQTMDFLIRAEANGIRIGRANFTAVDRRLHNNNMGRTMQKQENKDYARILRMKLNT